jgi:hypothetical protein
MTYTKTDNFSDEAAQKALNFLQFQAGEAAISRANRIYMEEFRKTIKANCMAASQEKALAAQERDAYASPEYIAHLEAMRAAIELDEVHRWKMVAAQATIEAWRTHQANHRGLLKMQ